MKLNRKKIFYAWLIFVAICIGIVLYDASFVRSSFEYLSRVSPIYLYLLIFFLGALRGFTLIPATYLILLGILFVPPLPLFLIILSGIIISSVSVYYFFEFLRVDEMLSERYRPYVDTATRYLERYEMPVIILWAMAPFLPSDIICYISGTLKVNIYKFALGMGIGEGIMSGAYIFGGEVVLQHLHGVIF